MRLAIAPYLLDFKEPAGTSRGIMTQKPMYLLKIWDEMNPSVYGIGEVSPLPGLSPEWSPQYEFKLVELLANIAIGKGTDLRGYPSIQFGLEQAILDFSKGGRRIYFDTPFIHGISEITINGLVWMGEADVMLARLKEKVNQGFKCIKFKIGAIDISDELELIRYIRKRFTASDLEIRVDANGAFNMDNVMPVLHELHTLNIHSIEQPIAPRQHELMSFLCSISPVPIALDEELIGVYDIENKEKLLSHIRPAYIVLKPSLCGGFSGASEWMETATRLGIKWWVTSALESNIGLNALAQWVATLGIVIPQGLGTGALYSNNFESPLHLQGDKLSYGSYNKNILKEQLDNLDWRE